MTTTHCAREAEILEAIVRGRWPEACEPELREHAATCRDCGDLAAVAAPLAEDRREGESMTDVPASGAVWWRVQMRMEREAKESAARTVRRVHSAMIVATVGAIVLVLAMTSLLRAVWGWLAPMLPGTSELLALMPPAPPMMILVLAGLAFAVLTPVAVYLACAEE